MNTIDHRILIPAPPNIVWNFVSNLANNPIWQVDCKNIAFLTTTHAGQGTRLRITSESGREQVVEITAWYNQLGYEYAIIDGTSFTQNKGRIRLQEIAEGTIVEWTFHYELGGMFSGLRNVLTTRRSVENTIVDSLWTLWRHVGQMQNDPDYHAKSLMRDAPDVEQRASYQPRHTSIVESTGQHIEQLDTSQDIHITEPPVAPDDTRPRPPVQPEQPDSAPLTSHYETNETVQEPDFLSGISTSEFSEIPRDTQNDVTNIDKVSVQETAIPVDDNPYKPPESKIQEPLATPDDTSPSEIVTPITQTETEQPTANKEFMLTRFDDNVAIDEEENETETLPKPPLIDEPPVSETDTSTVSVFDLFGVPKPSESQEVPAVEVQQDEISTPVELPTVVIEEPTVKQEDTQPKSSTQIDTDQQMVEKKPEVEVAEDTIITSTRTGQRYILRQKLVSLRRPE